MEYGLIQLYCGDGKGKTTAAVGQAVRCAGGGGKVLFYQFLKDNSSSERAALSGIEGITLRDGPEKIKFIFDMTENEKKEAALMYWRSFAELVAESDGYDMLVLDEIVPAAEAGLVSIDEICGFLENKSRTLEVVMTGRNPCRRLIEAADYVSEVKKIKHPFDKGIPARKMIEK